MKSRTDIREQRRFRYLFGPVPSRRMGLSLGVDLIPRKTCDFDCPFCEVGSTSVKTVARREYVSTGAVIAELKRWADEGGHADFVTLCGSGEPTLHSQFGRILEAVRRITPARTALLTNGSMLWSSSVRRDAAKADVVKVSVSAWNQKSFRKINNPSSSLSFEDVLDGMRTFRSEFTGELWVEVVVLAGINDKKDSMKRIAAIVRELSPSRIHLNTVVRPPARDSAKAVSAAKLNSFAGLFSPRAEVIGVRAFKGSRQGFAGAGSVVALLKRRPCTVADVAKGLGIGESEAKAILVGLVRKGVIRHRRQNGKIYHVCD